MGRKALICAVRAVGQTVPNRIRTTDALHICSSRGVSVVRTSESAPVAGSGKTTAAGKRFRAEMWEMPEEMVALRRPQRRRSRTSPQLEALTKRVRPDLSASARGAVAVVQAEAVQGP